MNAFGQRNDPVRLIWRRLGAVALLLLIVVFARGIWGVYKKEQGSRLLMLEAEAQLMDLEERERELREDIATLKTDRGIEGELRERYNLAREGEGVIVLVEPPEEEQVRTPTRLEKVREWLSF